MSFSKVVKRARKQDRGLWAIDRTSGFYLWHTKTIQEDVVIFPKLFRRLTSFFQRRGDYSQLETYIKNHKDSIKVIGDDKISSFDEITEVKDRHIALLKNPEDIIFML